MRKGKAAIVLLPEIALTAQTVERFTARFDADRGAALWPDRRAEEPGVAEGARPGRRMWSSGPGRQSSRRFPSWG